MTPGLCRTAPAVATVVGLLTLAASQTATVVVGQGGASTPPDDGVRMVADVGEGLKYWPRWRGPSGQGVVTGTGYPDRWSATQNVAWKVACHVEKNLGSALNLAGPIE